MIETDITPPAAPPWATERDTFTEDGAVSYERTLGKVPAAHVLGDVDYRSPVTLCRTDSGEGAGTPRVLVGHEWLTLDGARQLAALLTQAVELSEGAPDQV